MTNAPSVELYNSRTKQIEPFVPLSPPSVALYCCGPTVYDYQHIGNMRTYLFEDFLVRILKRFGFAPYHVMNITDVGHLVSDEDSGEDKMVVAARRERKSSMEIAAFYTDVFLEDCRKLNITRPDVICRATDHIPEMTALIERLSSRGLTYEAHGNVYFDVAKFPEYGALAGLRLDALKAGARVDVDEGKRSPHDFVLWFTKSKFENQELQWESPWGRGYPGWHIECSAMSMKYLGERFDIHCGGIDHIPVHHTNEIAQSEGAIGSSPWVSYWLHGEFLVIDKEKMSKSKGNFLTIGGVEERGIDPTAYRYLCLTTHYRKQMTFSWESLESAGRALDRLRAIVVALRREVGSTEIDPHAAMTSSLASEAIAAMNRSMAHDLNLPNALATLWESLGASEIPAEDKLRLMYGVDEVFGLRLKDWKEADVEIPPEVHRLVDERLAARAKRDFARSDELRDEIAKLGFSIEDTGAGPKIARRPV